MVDLDDIFLMDAYNIITTYLAAKFCPNPVSELYVDR